MVGHAWFWPFSQVVDIHVRSRVFIDLLKKQVYKHAGPDRKAILRDYINATIGFETLASQTGKSSKSRMRMFSVEGNPNADNLFAVISQLQKTTGNRLLVSASH